MAKLSFLRDCGAKVVKCEGGKGSVTIAFEEDRTSITSTGPEPAMRWSAVASNEEESVTRTFLDQPDQVTVHTGPNAQKYKQETAKLLYQFEPHWQVVE